MGGVKENLVLSDTDQYLVTGAPLGSGLTLDLDYHIPAAASSSNEILGAYTQTVTYIAIFN